MRPVSERKRMKRFKLVMVVFVLAVCRKACRSATVISSNSRGGSWLLIIACANAAMFAVCSSVIFRLKPVFTRCETPHLQELGIAILDKGALLIQTQF